MSPWMSEAEMVLLSSFLRCSNCYLEFGSGGSTVLAADLVGHSVVSVDSSANWLQKVHDTCATMCTSIRPDLLLADIGKTVEWGYPKNSRRREWWPIYHTDVWSLIAATDVDTCLIDGRFRVACCMQALLRTQPGTVVLIHDFANRTEYHVVHEFAREIARVELLSAFHRRLDFDAETATACLAEHLYDPR